MVPVMLMKIYDPNGTMFEVTPARAKKLSLQAGWTFSPKPVPLFKNTSKLENPPVTFIRTSIFPQEHEGDTDGA